MEQDFSEIDFAEFLNKSDDDLYKIIGEVAGQRDLYAGMGLPVGAPVGSLMTGGLSSLYGCVIGMVRRILPSRPPKPAQAIIKEYRINSGKAFIAELNNKIQNQICSNDFYNKYLGNDDPVNLVTGFATVISAFLPVTAAIAGAVILSRIGLKQYCKAYRTENNLG